MYVIIVNYMRGQKYTLLLHFTYAFKQAQFIADITDVHKIVKFTNAIFFREFVGVQFYAYCICYSTNFAFSTLIYASIIFIVKQQFWLRTRYSKPLTDHWPICLAVCCVSFYFIHLICPRASKTKTKTEGVGEGCRAWNAGQKYTNFKQIFIDYIDSIFILYSIGYFQ